MTLLEIERKNALTLTCRELIYTIEQLDEYQQKHTCRPFVNSGVCR